MEGIDPIARITDRDLAAECQELDDDELPVLGRAGELHRQP
jgi:hypothetical protein